ncbi:hypothetical protein C8J56DRAFT_968782 [Mycena floridula]|nr:hypothetical protein C8J56DRAFT_968782 [Mycena floridula]
MPYSFIYPVKSLLNNNIQPADGSDSSSSSSPPSSSPPSRSRRRKKIPSSTRNNPNFRHYPGSDNPSPQTFSTSPGMSTSTSASIFDDCFTPDYSLDDFDPRHPSALQVVVQDAFTTTSDSLLPHEEPGQPLEDVQPEEMLVQTEDSPVQLEQIIDDKHENLPWNPSELGIVYLGSGSSDGGSSHGRSTKKNSVRAHSSTPGSYSETSSSGEYYSTAASSDEPWLSVKFQHAQDENGNHVVIGREGTFTRCEDEPIRTPGAVQGFGVLIAVDEKDDVLEVRQVSENSTELLGLSPRYLFSLDCFSDILPDSQAAILWNNIEFLATGPEETSEDDNDSPHVFLLTGLGEPVDNGDSSARRSWTCWCAVHRPPMSNKKGLNLIIMEFELERDTLNPLYPPLIIPVPQGSTSRESHNSTDSSSSTLVTKSTKSELSEVAAISAPDSPSTSVVERLDLGVTPSSFQGLEGEEDWIPSAEDIMESTISRSKPLPALERLRRANRPIGSAIPADGETPKPRRVQRRSTLASDGSADSGRGSGVGIMNVFDVMAQINEQLGAAPDLDSFLHVLVGVIKDLTQFHRVMVYQFDEIWNGQVVAELVDWSVTHDLYRGLWFPAADIPAQARQLYTINKVRILYDRSQSTARLVARSQADLDEPLNMTHAYTRSMSPIHLKYLGNMGIRASMSVSIMAFGSLWGLVSCHSYGDKGMRVSFPVRQMLRLLSQSIARNIERLSYAQRLHTRKLINTISSDHHPTGYIVSNADDLLGLFDADFGILVIGEGAKILGPNVHGQEILLLAEYLRVKQFDTIQASQAITQDYPDLNISTGLEVISGVLYVPLSSGGQDFIAFLRKGQPRSVKWAGKPHKPGAGQNALLEPRKSFKIWAEIVAGRCRAWSDEQLETAGVLALVYGKFIEVWRQKETALNATKLTSLLLSNARHEVRTPLNHIINYLEMALDGPLDTETRDNLSRSHAASKNLLFTINDLLDLTRLESGNETSFNEPFNLPLAVEEAVHSYRNEAKRRNIEFTLDVQDCPPMVIGDSKKIRTVVQNLTANALKYTSTGSISIRCTPFEEPDGLRGPWQTAVEIVVADTGCGIAPTRLESIFREFEQVESSEPKSDKDDGVGLGLAVVAHVVEQLGGQLRVESQVDQGSRFSFLMPLSLPDGNSDALDRTSNGSSMSSLRFRSRTTSLDGRRRSADGEIDSLVEALSSSYIVKSARSSQNVSPSPSENISLNSASGRNGSFEVTDSQVPIRPVKTELEGPSSVRPALKNNHSTPNVHRISTVPAPVPVPNAQNPNVQGDAPLRVLIVEDNDVNRLVLAKRLKLAGHIVVAVVNGQEGLDKVKDDRQFDCILMDINMPILNGFESTEAIRKLEVDPSEPQRLSHHLNSRIPIFAVSASLTEPQRHDLKSVGMDGWILKPIDHKRLNVILRGVTDLEQRNRDMYYQGCSWERGGWLGDLSPDATPLDSPISNGDG